MVKYAYKLILFGIPPIVLNIDEASSGLSIANSFASPDEFSTNTVYIIVASLRK